MRSVGQLNVLFNSARRATVHLMDLLWHNPFYSDRYYYAETPMRKWRVHIWQLCFIIARYSRISTKNRDLRAFGIGQLYYEELELAVRYEYRKDYFQMRDAEWELRITISDWTRMGSHATVGVPPIKGG